MHDHRNTPLFRKAEEIRELAKAIVESAPDQADEAGDRFEAHMLEASKNEIMSNAYMIGAKIAGAYGMGVYDLQMENACLIRRACRVRKVRRAPGRRRACRTGWRATMAR